MATSSTHKYTFPRSPKAEEEPKPIVHRILLPNGGTIVECGKFTFWDGITLIWLDQIENEYLEWKQTGSKGTKHSSSHPEFSLPGSHNPPDHPEYDPFPWAIEIAKFLYGYDQRN